MDEEFIVFDPDFELEWEVGPDNDIVFEPCDHSWRLVKTRQTSACSLLDGAEAGEMVSFEPRGYILEVALVDEWYCTKCRRFEETTRT